MAPDKEPEAESVAPAPPAQAPKPKTPRKPRAPRKGGRKLTREHFVDAVVVYQATGNRPGTWGYEDDWKRYISTQAAITPDEMAAARKRCNL